MKIERQNSRRIFRLGWVERIVWAGCKAWVGNLGVSVRGRWWWWLKVLNLKTGYRLCVVVCMCKSTHRRPLTIEEEKTVFERTQRAWDTVSRTRGLLKMVCHSIGPLSGLIARPWHLYLKKGHSTFEQESICTCTM